jgi:hypothetical protein
MALHFTSQPTSNIHAGLRATHPGNGPKSDKDGLGGVATAVTVITGLGLAKIMF